MRLTPENEKGQREDGAGHTGGPGGNAEQQATVDLPTYSARNKDR